MPQQEPTYPKPPFAEQDEPWPALACKMPPPDRGEPSCAGSGHPGQPAEIAPLCVTLASHETSYTAGNVWGSTGCETGP